MDDLLTRAREAWERIGKGQIAYSPERSKSKWADECAVPLMDALAKSERQLDAEVEVGHQLLDDMTERAEAAEARLERLEKLLLSTKQNIDDATERMSVGYPADRLRRVSNEIADALTPTPEPVK